MRGIFLAFLLVLGFCLGGGATFAAERVYYGYPSLKEGQDGKLWILTQDGQETALLGDMSANKKVEQCLQSAFGLNEMVKFSANWVQNEYNFQLDPASAQCGTITNQADCPRKVLRTVTLDAINQGVVCGDFCHLGLLPEYGDEFSVYADEETIEKLFGEKPGKKVRVTYTVELDWQPDSIENPENGEGICGISTFFKSGKLLSK